MTNRRVTLAKRPAGEPTNDCFAFDEVAVPNLGEGELRLRTLYLSLDPYVRGMMGGYDNYAGSLQIGDVMEGGSVCQVEASRHPDFAVGEIVQGYGGSQEVVVTGAEGWRKVDPALAPISTALGVLGMPGFTAYYGLLDIGKPKAGETVVVSAASGAVGATVGQIAKLKGARVVGIAGAPEKCAYVEKELGFDACVSHRSKNLATDIKAACPKGIDVYFENVGGDTLAALWPLMNDDSRFVLCGQIAHYNETSPPKGIDRLPDFLMDILTKHILVQGFIISSIADHDAKRARFLEEMGGWVKSGKIRYCEDIAEGLDKAPEAFIGLLRGRNFGKQLVRLALDPTKKA